MKPLMSIPPAQAEALYDARQEQPDERFFSLPWQDDDALEDAGPPPKTPPVLTGNHRKRYSPRPMRAA